MTSTPSTDQQVSFFTRICYGIGSVAFGVKDNGLSYFLLIYYNQVLGLPAAQAGFIILIALLFDAVSDPIVGHISDNIHSRWGRRHPFMYASAIPVGLAYYMLWNPPDLTTDMLFWYALGFTTGVRFLITFYEIPSTAMGPELTDSYHERTSIYSFRAFFGWFGGTSMGVITYMFLLVPTEDYPTGQLNPEGFQTMGIVGAIIIVSAILFSSIGTHKEIPNLRQPPPKQPQSLRRVFRESRETLTNPSFLTMFAAVLFFAAGAGVTAGFTLYMMTYFWGLTALQLAFLTLGQYFSASAALVFTRPVSERIGKKRAAVLISTLAFTLGPMPVILRLLGFFPANDSPILWPLLAVFFIVDITFIIAAGILVTSMMADLVEDSETVTGRRSEGLFFAARTFALKAVSGFGVFFTSLMLAVVEFPENAEPGKVPEGVLFDMGMIYAGAILLIYSMAVILLSLYRIDETQHQENLENLEVLRRERERLAFESGAN